MEGVSKPHQINDYRDLKVWKDSMDITVDIYRATASFPQSEAFGLTSQMRRSASSIPANIAEGFGRQQRKSFIQFLRIAQGSLKELETHMELARRIEVIGTDTAGDFAIRFESLGKMLRSLISKLSAKGTAE